MKKFIGHLEEAIQWQNSVSKLLFDIGVRFDNLKFPMSTPMLKRVWPDSIRATVFHVTGPQDYSNVAKLQGKKSSISAFFEMSAHYLSTGIQTKGGVVVELDANVLVSGGQDLMSAPDKSGRRWVDLYYLKSFGGDPREKKIEKEFEKLAIELIKKYVPSNKAHKVSLNKPVIAWINLGTWLRDDKVEMKNLIKEYIDEVEKILKKYQDYFKTLFYDYMEKRTTKESWDEQVVNQFKIKKVHLITDAQVWSNPTVGIKFSDFVKTIPKGIRVVKWLNALSLELYIKDVASKGTGTESSGIPKDDDPGDVSDGSGREPKMVRIK